MLYMRAGSGARRARAGSVALASESELRGARAPKQVRSVALLQRVAAAARDLFTTRDYELVTVADIAAAAGVSVGAVYTRFPSKEHLLVYLVGDVAEELSERMARALSPDRWRDSGLSEVVRFYLAEMAAAFVTHRWVLRPATIVARQVRDEALTRLLAEFNRRIHGQFRELVLAASSEIAHPDPAQAVDVVILMVSAAMREAVLYGEPVSRLAPTQARLVDELHRAAVLYLTGKAP